MTRAPLKLPNIYSPQFAEFYGIMLGDGCIYSNLTGICIGSDSLLDKHYISDYIPFLLSSLFGIQPRLYLHRYYREIRCLLYSAHLARFMVNLGFQPGIKNKGHQVIPSWFFGNPRLLTACLRGLHDTDGSICPHPHTKIMSNLSIVNHPSLLESVHRAFRHVGIPMGKTTKGMNLYGGEKIDHFFEIIGSSNYKHILKYVTFLERGFVPRSTEIEMFLRGQPDLFFEVPYHGPVV